MAATAKTEAARVARIDKALAAALHKDEAHGGEDTLKIRVCSGTTCNASGRAALTAALRRELDARGLSDKVAVVETGCHGLCEEGPIVVVHPRGVFYPRLKPRDIAQIIEKSVVGDGVVERLLYRDPETDEAIALEKDIPFYAGQTRLVRGISGLIDPTSIDDYLARGGYTSLAKVLKQDDPVAVIDEVEASGLRGSSGAGFPTAKKWRYCRNNPGDRHYIICNADEGDPGVFTDRAVLEDNPHSLIEGMLIAAYAIGADEGFIYARHEYPLAVARLRHALDQARERGLLGDGIMGTDWDFDLRINQGAGAFVCGESTALTASLEGNRGMPRGKHIRTVAHGLYQQPTSLNNVETYATVPWIIANGAQAFAAMGTGTSHGTKIFSPTGKLRHPGLVEVPLGTTLREVIFGIAGGMADGHEFKAVHMGGPSGGSVPAELLDTPLDFESLNALRRGDGLGRHGGARRTQLHGRLRPALPEVRFAGVVRQVRPLPGRHTAHARDPRPHRGRRRRDGRSRAPRAALRRHHRGLALPARRQRPQPRTDLAALLPRRVRRPHRRQALPGQGLPAADPLYRERQVHRLLRLHHGLPHRGGQG